MAMRARGLLLLRGRLGRGPALLPGTAGRALRGFRSSRVRTSREKRFHLPEIATVCLPTCPHPQSSF
ncbi:bifunctional methylenetetrahydrofolate dehydrogenase/cyclohydrolase 2, mitochondrial isoform X5 [Dipodomys merriami]|uniref:bifunctional methylenetetrahydrofolate dehydrogenase/cyclohydrolase 2, mitochondrial isoform X5 n=1 Tax=Dipodomys merriami TaxID=94247 RepID=UPI003855FA18